MPLLCGYVLLGDEDKVLSAAKKEEAWFPDLDAPRVPCEISRTNDDFESTTDGMDGPFCTGVDVPLCQVPELNNPGTKAHPDCRPCAFVFRLANDYVRLRCANMDTCEFCHDPSHRRYRGRRREFNRKRSLKSVVGAADVGGISPSSPPSESQVPSVKDTPRKELTEEYMIDSWNQYSESAMKELTEEHHNEIRSWVADYVRDVADDEAFLNICRSCPPIGFACSTAASSNVSSIADSVPFPNADHLL